MAKLLKTSCLHVTPLVRDEELGKCPGPGDGSQRRPWLKPPRPREKNDPHNRTSSAQASDVANENVRPKRFHEEMAARNVLRGFRDKA